MRAEIVIGDTGACEGPVYCQDGTLVIVSVDRGLLYRIWPDQQSKAILADTAGGPNAAALAADGGVVITQNGGIDYEKLFAEIEVPPEIPIPRGSFGPYRPVTAGLQRVQPNGQVTYLAEGGFMSPNDLVVGRDGTVYFTDPPRDHAQREELAGRVWGYRPDGTLQLVADGFWFCNGIALDNRDNLVVVERQGLQRINPDGTREWVIEVLGPGGGDGLCVDADGRCYVAAVYEHGVRVIEDGREVDFLELPGGGVTTNCCFGGPDMRTLFATDMFPGAVVAWEAMPTAGLPTHAWHPQPESAQPA
jgi:gluconolactonase